MQYLSMRGHYIWRNNSGGFKVDTRYIRAGKTGSSDIIGIAKDGRFIAIECKDIKGCTTPAQEEFLNEIRVRGGYSVVAKSLDDVINIGL